MAAVVSYDALRASAKISFAEQASLARTYVSKLQKAQRAAEKALDMFACLALHAHMDRYVCVALGFKRNVVAVKWFRCGCVEAPGSRARSDVICEIQGMFVCTREYVGHTAYTEIGRRTSLCM